MTSSEFLPLIAHSKWVKNRLFC